MTNHSLNRRYHDLDALRAFAMLLGILLHGAMSLVALPVTVNPTQDIYQNSPFYGWLMDAIHGFRMPLFFVVSGIFTAMLWRRRGTRGLIRHRLRRIGIPLLIGLFTIVPAVFAVNILLGRNIWQASATGDTEYVNSYVSTGRDLNAPLVADMQPGNGGTPLHLAAASAQYEVAAVLIDAGAEINSRAIDKVLAPSDPSSSQPPQTTPQPATSASQPTKATPQPSMATPLHWAAAMGDKRMIELLLDRGAEKNASDSFGRTPLDYVSGDQPEIATALADAGGKLGSALGEKDDQLNRSQIKEALATTGAQAGSSGDYLGDWIRRSSLAVQIFALLCYFPVFVHLWFLWYLLWLVAFFIVAAKISQRFGFKAIRSQNFMSPRLWCWVLPTTFAAQFLMVQSFGPDTAAGLIPWPPTLLYYGLFFGFGALYQSRTDLDAQLGDRYLQCMAIALLILPIGIYATGARQTHFLLYHSIGTAVAATYAWLMIVGLFGLFRNTFASEKAWVRYISDASYWIYLVHLPIVQGLQSWLSDQPIAAPLKLAIICVVTLVVTLVSYEAVVRYTWIGAILHGRKYRQPESLEPAAHGAALNSHC